MENTNPMEIEMLEKEEMPTIKNVIDKLLAGKVNFIYKKKDGSIRQATGTLSPDLIPDVEMLTTKKIVDHCQNYYDLDKGEWRTFIKANFIEIKE